jgi:hypothetical protein
VADDVARRHHLAADDIVGQVEHGGDEQPVGSGRPRPGSRRAAADRQPLRHEAALGADRHDHRVLDALGLLQSQHLGAEVLRPVGPADAAAGDLAAAQMHPLDVGRIDEDFGIGPRLGQGVLDAPALDLERDARRIVAVSVGW